MKTFRRHAGWMLLGLGLFTAAAAEPGKAERAAGIAEAKAMLKSLAGSWTGTCRTWFEPGKLADESRVTGTIRPILDGLMFRHEYESTMQGKPRHGEETIAYNSITRRFQVSWFDNFHMSDAILFSEGETVRHGFSVAAKYVYDPKLPAWGWKTVYEVVDEDHLTITAYNISPEGVEMLGVETKYQRVKP